MKPDSNSLISDVLSLSVNERIEVVEKLLESLDAPNQEIAEVWAQEADNRIEHYEKGALDTVSVEDVLKKYK